MTKDDPRMGDLNELVERLRIGTPENPEYEVVWVQNLRAHFKEGMFSRQFFPEWNDIFLANVNDLLAASTEAAAAITSLIAERDGLEAWFDGLAPNEMHDSITRLKDRALAAEAQLRSANEALARYDAALANREHGGVAAHRCVDDLRTALSLDTNKGDGV